MHRVLRLAVAITGLIATPIYWIAVVLLAAGPLLGECFAAADQTTCPSDLQRRLTAATFVLGGTLIYGLGVLAWRSIDAALAARST